MKIRPQKSLIVSFAHLIVITLKQIRCVKKVNVNVKYKEYKDVMVLSYNPDFSFMPTYIYRRRIRHSLNLNNLMLLAFYTLKNLK